MRERGDVELWFVRHGESEWNARGLWQGQGDPPLSARGRRQAEALAAAWAEAGMRPALLACSDLRRAHETARILAQRLGRTPLADPGLRERDVGLWSGLSKPEIARRFPEEWRRHRAGDPELRPGGGESWQSLAQRVEAALGRLAARARERGGALAVVSHLGVLRVLSPGASLENAAWRRIQREASREDAYASLEDAL